MVGVVIYVAVDFGVVVEPAEERGVKGVKGARVLGDSSGRGGRTGCSLSLLNEILVARDENDPLL